MLVDTLVGTFDNAACESAEFIINIHKALFHLLAVDNTVSHACRTPPSPLARLLLAWDRECARMHRVEKRSPTLAEQRAFFA